jgi:hypothetical protein
MRGQRREAFLVRDLGFVFVRHHCETAVSPFTSVSIRQPLVKPLVATQPQFFAAFQNNNPVLKLGFAFSNSVQTLFFLCLERKLLAYHM